MDFTPATLISAVTLVFVIMSFAFGRGDKHGAAINELKEKVHAMELAQVGQYATKADMDALRSEIRQRFVQLNAMLIPIFKRMAPDAVLPE